MGKKDVEVERWKEKGVKLTFKKKTKPLDQLDKESYKIFRPQQQDVVDDLWLAREAEKEEIRLQRSQGGKADKEKYGILSAIQKIIKQTGKSDALSLWEYFAQNHNGYAKALRIGDYEIFFQFDIEGISKNSISRLDAAKRAVLVQITNQDNSTMRTIKLPTFRQKVSRIRKIMSK